MTTRVLAVAALLCAPALARADLRLGSAVTPTFESIRLEIDPARPDYTGSVRIDLTVAAGVDSFRFHAREMKLDRVALRGPAGAVGLTHREGAAGLVVVRPERTFAPGAYVLEIDFANDFDTRATSLYRLEIGGRAYSFTQFEAVDARGAFPCWDEPEFKIPWQMTLVVPAADLAISNTPIERETREGARRTVVFERTPPMPSYLLAIATGPLETVPIEGMSVPGRVVTVRGARHLATDAAKTAPPILAALERYFGRPYPYRKLDLIAVPEFWPGAMENAGAITFADRALLLDPATAGPKQRRTLVTYLAHEMAHMWFGDLVTMRWWDDLWLNESFASWIGDKISQETFPEFDIPVLEVEARQEALELDARPSIRAMRQPVGDDVNLDQLADALAYNKGQALLVMYESWLGTEVARRGVRDYIERHAWKNTVAADLWSALGRASGRDVAASLGSYVDQPGTPIVTAEPLGDGRVRLRQQRFLARGGAPAKPPIRWKIPVRLAWSDGAQVRQQSVLLDRETQIVRLEGARRDPVWLHPNAGEGGYYRWSLPERSHRALIDHADALDVRERVGLLRNAGALFESGQLHGPEYLALLEHFGRDPAPQVIEAVVDGVRRVHDVFGSPDLESTFAAWTRAALGPALGRIGLTPTAGEPASRSLARPELLLALGELGRDPRVNEPARAWADAFLERPASVDPLNAEVGLALAAVDGDLARFERYRRAFESAQVPADRRRLLSALGEFRRTEPVERMLGYSLTGPLRPNEILVPANQLAKSTAHQDRVFRWMTASYDSIARRIPPTSLSELALFADGCSRERLAAAQAFFATPGHAPAGIEEQLSRVADRVTDCAALHDREVAAVRRYLGTRTTAPAEAAGSPLRTTSYGSDVPGSTSTTSVCFCSGCLPYWSFTV